MSFRSKGEEKLYNNYLLKYLSSNVKIIQEVALKNYGCPRKLSADFLLCNIYNEPMAVIEVQGLQHFQDEKVIERDAFKRRWCHDNFISYVDIYWDCKKLDFTVWAQEWKEEWAEDSFIGFLENINEFSTIKYPSLEERNKNREEWIKILANEMQKLISQLNS